ncbi:hypothetical protein GGX14DRAFT_664518 [Mycena pura]|uniref:HNH nuclease domain-containing protein n=1 Tax=Mycena pura TaxID=153505 RepID=A0AAD7E190_9AGAR|nr:hypothetical protein GGX14DRAFT_664518 [Mycena pura]
MPATRKSKARTRVARPLFVPEDPLPTREFMVYHHGYEPRAPILQLFSSPVDPNGDLDDIFNYALPYDLVLEACALLANNERGTLHISDDTGHEHGYRYRLCRAFKYWTPGDIPTSFFFDERSSKKYDFPPTTASAVTRTVKGKDEKCVLTGVKTRCDLSHLLPTSVAAWFFKCRFNIRANDSSNLTVNSPNNQLILRTDLNGRGLDVADFCFFPLPDEKNEHNFREVALPPRIRAAYLFGRFAWNVFFLAQKCFEPQKRTLRFLKNNNGKKKNNDKSNDYGKEGDGDGEEEEDEDGEENEDGSEENEDGSEENEDDGGEEDDDGGEEDGDGGGGGGKRKRGGAGGEGERKRGGGGGGGRGGGRGGGGGGGKGRKPGGGGGRGGSGAAPTRVQPTRGLKILKKPHPAAQLADRPMKKPRLDAALDDVPDLSPIDLSALQIMKHLDRRLQAEKLPYSQSSEWYPGFARIAETAYNYKVTHPAVTDPGGARIALVSERDEE